MNRRERDCSQHASACVLVIREPGLVLAVWNGKHECWGLPGGKREPEDKTIRHTAYRELREETGLKVTVNGFRPHDLLFEGDCSLAWLYSGNYQSLPKSDPVPREVHLYVASCVFGVATPKEQLLAWMTWPWLLEAAPAFRTYYEDALPDGVRHLRPTEFR